MRACFISLPTRPPNLFLKYIFTKKKQNQLNQKQKTKKLSKLNGGGGGGGATHTPLKKKIYKKKS